MSSIKLKGDTSGEITIQAPSVAGTNTLNLQASSGTLATTAQASIGMKNRIINGDMRIDQRDSTATINGTGVTYNVDRWLGRGETSEGVFTLAQDTTSPANFSNSLKATVTTDDDASPMWGTSSYRIQQQIEGYNIADLNWGTSDAQSVTLSFWVRSSVTGTLGGSVANGDFNRFNPFSYTISAANTWEYKTVTIAGDTSGTWVTNNALGLRLNFSLGAGADRLGTAGTWTSSVLEGVTGQVNPIQTNGSTFYITGVQLEAGTTATPFENLQYGQQLALCQRYFEPIINDSLNYNGGQIIGSSYNTTRNFALIYMKQIKRATPTIAASGVGGSILQNNTAKTVTALLNSYPDIYSVGIDITASVTQGAAFHYNPSATTLITADAEL